MESSTPVLIDPRGDVLLDVTFHTSPATLRAAKKASAPRPTQPPSSIPQEPLKSTFTKTYRVSSTTLKSHSAYFDRLLFDTRLGEGRRVRTALDALFARGLSPADAELSDLPRVQIKDDDEASRAAGREREAAYSELLRILHAAKSGLKSSAKKVAKPTDGPAPEEVKESTEAYRWSPTKPPTLLELATLAVLADYCQCVTPVASYVRSLKFRFPQAQVRPRSTDTTSGAGVLVNEEAIRQKILIGWLLDQPLKFQLGTRELINHGSKRWSPFFDEEAPKSESALWWNLPDGLEDELRDRRDCILRCIASIQGHFLRLYSSRERQCKLGYMSSPACDSFQLGEMVRFLANKELLVLGDFTGTVDGMKDWSGVDVGQILATLKQCPSYQVDRNHTNCGLRTRVLPIVEYVQSMLSSNVVAVARPTWQNNQEGARWGVDGEDGRDGIGGGDEDKGVFKFTRGLSGDQRLRYEGAMAADRMARRLFTARRWDWTPDD